VRIAASLVSSGTERAASEFAGKNLLQKAKARPDLVREVVAKVRRDGLFSAMAAVRSRLDQPLALGYSSAGTIVEVGEGINELSVGDHVACSGAGYAVHAEFACVPRLLVAKVPSESSVTPEEAAFTTVGSVALHGVRTAEAKLGDVVAVVGLGLLGQLTVQLLKAAGCHVIGMDVNPARVDLALRLGADAVSVYGKDFEDLCLRHSAGNGVDTVLITAATSSSEPVNLASTVARDRGIVVAVGTVGMDLERRGYYEKELDFRVARSYGPGRYDSAYEQKGRDYPIGYVRWTETRNMDAFIRLLSDGKLDVKSLITHRFGIAEAGAAYDVINGKTRGASMGVLIVYPEQAEGERKLQLVSKTMLPTRESEPVSLGVLGAGSFAMSALLPAMKRVRGVKLVGICAGSGPHARRAAEKFGFSYCSTEEDSILHDRDVNTVVIATRHHLHTRQVLAALAEAKHVFCEKPLCLTETDLAEIVRAYSRHGLRRSPVLMVGFNRRFAPMAIRMSTFLKQVGGPFTMHYRVNAGFVPPDHWVNDPEQGGGRLLGEVCHFIDFVNFLVDADPVEVQASDVATSSQSSGQNMLVQIEYANGSHATISYVVDGDRLYSKERVEVFGGGAVAVLDDFRRLELVRHGNRKTITARFRQDKGHRAEVEIFFDAIREGLESPVPFSDIVRTTLTTLRAAESRTTKRPSIIDTTAFIQASSASVKSSPEMGSQRA
jgi:predicted dehydrogenase/threonine dehydrogenase-like Zn-dependent dehydrogenase